MMPLSTRFRLALTLLASLGLTLISWGSASALSAHAVTQTASLQALQQYGEATCAQPPAGIAPLLMTDAQLSLYGLPLHEEIRTQSAAWVATLAHVQHRYCGSQPALSTTNGPASSSAPAVTTQKYYGPHWGGNGAYGARGTYRSVSATFVVPSVSTFLQNTATVSFWVGLGGVAKTPANQTTGTYALIQAGVSITVTVSGTGQLTQVNHAFWEALNQSSDNGEKDFPMPVKVNDTVSVLVDSNLNNSGTNFFYVDDSSSGAYSSSWSNYLSDSATGECIAERNSTSSFSSLADFGTERFRSCWVGTNSSGNYVNNVNHYDFVPTTDGTSSGAPLMTINALDSTGDFSVTWLRSS